MTDSTLTWPVVWVLMVCAALPAWTITWLHFKQKIRQSYEGDDTALTLDSEPVRIVTAKRLRGLQRWADFAEDLLSPHRPFTPDPVTGQRYRLIPLQSEEQSKQATLKEALEKDIAATLAREKVYAERSQVIALAMILAERLGHSVGLTRTAIEGWDPQWQGLAFIKLPEGQVSWHYHVSHARFFRRFKQRAYTWDGHATSTKYRRIERFVNRRKPYPT